MTDFARLREVKAQADSTAEDRRNYQAYVDYLVTDRGWSPEDVKEYRDAVEQMMKHGTDDDRQAASEYWARFARTPASVITSHIKVFNQQAKAA